jgi:hypothetical protein
MGFLSRVEGRGSRGCVFHLLGKMVCTVFGTRRRIKFGVNGWGMALKQEIAEEAEEAEGQWGGRKRDDFTADYTDFTDRVLYMKMPTFLSVPSV